MKRLWQPLFATFITALLTACGGSGTSGNPVPVEGLFRIDGLEYGLKDKGTLETGETRISGSGTAFFVLPHAENNNFKLNVELQPGGSVTLVTHTADKSLEGGINITAKRVAADKLSVTAKVGSWTYDYASDYAEELAELSATGTLAFEFDVHQHGDAIVEVGGKKMGVDFPQGPNGRIWGVTLDKAVVTKPQVVIMKYPH